MFIYLFKRFPIKQTDGDLKAGAQKTKHIASLFSNKLQFSFIHD